MPFGYVSAGAAVVSAVGSLTADGGQSQQPTAAGWDSNAMALTDMMGTSNADQFDPYNQYGTQWADQYGQAQAIQQQVGQQASTFNNSAAALTSQQQALSGQVTDASNAYLNSGQQGQYQSAMNALQPAYYGAGQQAFNMGNQLQGQMGQTQAAGNAILQAGFDPQQTLYNQSLQQEQQQSDSNQAMRGLAMSGAGAELSNQADLNFNTNWQNQQLGRETTALGAYDVNNTSLGQLAQSANQSYSTGLSDQTTGAGLGYNAAQTIYNNNNAAYGQQQQALSADQAAFLAQQQTYQQGLGNQTSALTGAQSALANQQNNLAAGNSWYNNQESSLMGYYSGSVPTYNPTNAAATANGYAGLGNFLGSGTGQGVALNGAVAAANPGATSSTGADGTVYSGTGGTSLTASPGIGYDAYAGSSAYAMPTATAYTGAADAGTGLTSYMGALE